MLSGWFSPSTKARAKRKGPLSQYERGFLAAETALVLPIAGYLPFRKGLPAFLKGLPALRKALLQCRRGL